LVSASCAPVPRRRERLDRAGGGGGKRCRMVDLLLLAFEGEKTLLAPLGWQGRYHPSPGAHRSAE
jgi:hypothetical protein